jgi:hypothetical protein
MNLIDAYLLEIGRRLPAKNRSDIEAEIRSILQDLLDERSESLARPIDDELVLAVLEEYGSPEKVAASYQPERYLIGPRLFPSYLTVLQTVLPIVAVLSLISFGITLGRMEISFERFFETFFIFMAELMGSLISAAGVITLLFAIFQWVIPDLSIESREWDPRSLLKVRPGDSLKTASLVFDLVFTALGILLFNFFPHLISAGFAHPGGGWWIGVPVVDNRWVVGTPILSEAFFRYLPLLNILWGFSIVFMITLLIQGRWQGWSRWAALSLKILAIGVVIALLTGPSLIGLTAENLMDSGFPDETAAKILVNLFQQGLNVALVVSVVVNAIDAVKLILLLTGRDLPIVLRRFSES